MLTGAASGFTDAVTFAFADRDAGFFGLARVGRRPAARAARSACCSRAREPVEPGRRGRPRARDAGWDGSRLPGCVRDARAAASAGGRARRRRAGLRARVRGADAAAASESRRAGGMEGHERLCRVRGTTAGRPIDVPRPARALVGHAGLGRDRAHALARRLARRRAGVVLGACVRRGAATTPTRRLGRAARRRGRGARWTTRGSPTTYDGDGQQRRAGLELWVGEDDDYPRRGAGEVLCGSSVELGALRLDVAFFALDDRRPRGRRALRRAAARLNRRAASFDAGVEGALERAVAARAVVGHQARSGAPHCVWSKITKFEAILPLAQREVGATPSSADPASRCRSTSLQDGPAAVPERRHAPTNTSSPCSRERRCIVDQGGRGMARARRRCEDERGSRRRGSARRSGGSGCIVDVGPRRAVMPRPRGDWLLEGTRR